MILPFKKTTDNAASSPTGRAPKSLSYEEFIPYYCHYDANTLMTKDGGLLQIIKVTGDVRGVEYEGSDPSGISLRDVVRAAIGHGVQSQNFSMWLHTLRKRKQVNFSTKFKEAFAGYAHKKWEKKQKWKNQYYNEFYITLLHDGQSAILADKEALKHVVLPSRNRVYRNAYLDNAAAHLQQVTSDILVMLQDRYNARRLTTVERLPLHLDPLASRPIFYSEPLEFLGTIINLRAEEHPLPDVDLSVAVQTHDLTFGYNAMETRSATGKRRFGALLTLKQYREVSPEMVDHVLQAPLEIIISQAFHFISDREALQEYKPQHDLFRISGDEASIRSSGLEDMLQGAGIPMAYGAQQTTIMVIADEYKLLSAEAVEAQAAFAKLGLITVREDIKLEEGYWAQLPGNFSFLRRKDPLLTSQIGGFCRLNRFPNGSATDNHWGEAVTLMPTIVNSPYYFNFHHRDNGHSVLFDYNSFNDQNADVLLHFLLSETRKYGGKLFVFDRHHSAKLFFSKLGGQYHHFMPSPDHPKRGVLALNPFWLNDSPRNRSFLLAWVFSLISDPVEATDASKEVLKQAIDELFTLDLAQRHLRSLVERIAPTHQALANAFAPWHGRGKFARIFDTESEALDLSNQQMHGFDMEALMASPESIIPVFSYLMHRIITTLDGKPTTIVLRDAWDLLENPFFAPRLESLLEMLQQSNVMVVFTTKRPRDVINTHIFSTVMRCCATHLFLPDDIGVDYESEALNLSLADTRMLLHMNRQNGEFLLKQNQESIGLRVDMTGMDDLQAIFSNNIKNLIAAGGEYASLPDDI